MKKCVFAGTFDPMTVGHEDTVKKALGIFDEVVVAVAENKQKRCMFSAAEREQMVRAVFEGEPRVRVVLWEGTIADLLSKENTPFYVRGIRNTVDLEYENADLEASRDISPGIVAVYFPSEREHRYISSTLVKNCIAFQKPYADYVPAAVLAHLKNRG